MPRYFFQVHDGAGTVDDDGMDFPDLAAARVEAVRLGGAILRDQAERFVEAQDWHLEVTDAAGLILFTLWFAAIDAPGAAR